MFIELLPYVALVLALASFAFAVRKDVHLWWQRRQHERWLNKNKKL